MSDLNEKLAQEAAELINGGEWRDGKWYSDGQRDAWRRALKPAADRIEKLETALEALSHIHDGNPSDAYAGVPELDYARHMLWEARQIARNALEGKDD